MHDPATFDTPLPAGRPWPLGAHWDGAGVNLAVMSRHAEAMELCIFEPDGRRVLAQWRLPARSGDVFHGYMRGAGPGLVYGLRAHGSWAPERGHRFNAAKLLLDPYAREIVGSYEWRGEHFASERQPPFGLDRRDNAEHALKARVVDPRHDWGDDRHPEVPRDDTVVYELHVKGWSKLNERLPAPLRGTYAGLAHPASIDYLRRLGVTSLNLLPVHQHLDEQRLVAMGLSNYWGYNTIGFFAVEPSYASGVDGLSPRDEFRAMVRRLHAAGLEVILDVVYNHTAETDEFGPTLCWRGLDNATYYRLRADDLSLYDNPTGCGNALNVAEPRVLQLVMDSLRYWVEEMHVDGFRFDLAPVLGRGAQGFDARAAFFQAVQQDPVLQRVKLVAEPWDIGAGGYQVGGFPRGWMEWNDRFRDGIRGWWLAGPTRPRGELAQRLAGSADLYEGRGRPPAESVNFIVAHDGFTLRDLVSYGHKHNDANGEDNRDGHAHNLSWNCGHEGETDEPAVQQRRAVLQRSLLATLLYAQGTPMLCAGDELGHTQRGNNNPYCQDNPITWIEWSRADGALIEHTAQLLALRREHRPLGTRWYHGRPSASGWPDLGWRQPDGRPLAPDDWGDPTQRALAALIGEPGREGATQLLLFNAATEPVRFVLPRGLWRVLSDSARAGATEPTLHYDDISLAAHALVLLCCDDPHFVPPDAATAIPPGARP